MMKDETDKTWALMQRKSFISTEDFITSMTR